MLRVIQYPHPTLRRLSKPLKRVDAEVREIVREMFELMYKHRGVGLAANQVDLPYRLFITNPMGDPKSGEEHVFINPVLRRPRGLVEAEEGCLSIPEVYAPVKRADKIDIDAYDLDGQPVHLELDGLHARVVQHENDHIDGRLFIDRLSTTAALDVRDALRQFEDEFLGGRERGHIPSDAEIAARWTELENLRT
jgi:peptide deformylase